MVNPSASRLREVFPDVMGGPDASEREDELGGGNRACTEDGLGGPDQPGREDELGGVASTQGTDVLGGPDRSVHEDVLKPGDS